jgi:hypothetical protein
VSPLATSTFEWLSPTVNHEVDTFKLVTFIFSTALITPKLLQYEDFS